MLPYQNTLLNMAWILLIGTTIRPYRDGKDHDYGLDVLAIINRKKANTDARSVKNDVGDCIKESGVYSSKLERSFFDKSSCTLIVFFDFI